MSAVECPAKSTHRISMMNAIAWPLGTRVRGQEGITEGTITTKGTDGYYQDDCRDCRLHGAGFGLPALGLFSVRTSGRQVWIVTGPNSPETIVSPRKRVGMVR